MDSLPDDILNKIYEYKHNLEYTNDVSYTHLTLPTIYTV